MASFTLPACCDQGAATDLQRQLIAAGSGAHRIDGSQAGQISQAMLQLLISARLGGALITPSAALREVAGLTGLSDVLFAGDEA
ncbi:MAG: hypothetical protein EBR34_03995 [Sphingomonadaceae bacterium]|nr:hypothetical protein [Sphingomonadaceae bacterium]